MGKVAGHEVRAGGGVVAQAAERADLAAGHRFLQRGDGGHHPAAAQPVGGVVLVVDGDVEQRVRSPGEAGGGGHEPGAEAVGVDGDVQRHRGRARVAEAGQPLHQVAFQHAHQFDMPAEPGALLGGRAGGAVLDQHGAEPFLQEAHPLRDGRGRDGERPRGLVETAGADDGGDGLGGGVVDHPVSSS